MSEVSRFDTEPYFIAYIDILGYRDMVGNGDVHLAVDMA